MKHQDSKGFEEPEKIVAIRKIRMLMDFWRISPHELRGKPETAPQPRPLRVVRYRHPVTGMSWDGEGSQPDWLRVALLREGYTVDELRRAASASDEADAVQPAPVPASA